MRRRPRCTSVRMGRRSSSASPTTAWAAPIPRVAPVFAASSTASRFSTARWSSRARRGAARTITSRDPTDRIDEILEPCTHLPTGTVTFLFADVEGSTALQQDPNVDYAAAVALLRRLLRNAISTNGGAETDAVGDEYVAAFADARAAVEAAFAVQRALRDTEWPNGAKVRVRIGLHTGVPSLDEEGYTGVDVVRASRIANAGHGGQIVVSARDARSDRRRAQSAPRRAPARGARATRSRSTSCSPTIFHATFRRSETRSRCSALGSPSCSPTTPFSSVRGSRACSPTRASTSSRSPTIRRPHPPCRHALADRRRRRHPHAADAHGRGPTRGGRDPRPLPGDRRARPLAVRRGRVRAWISSHDDAWDRLPPQGSRRATSTTSPRRCVVWRRAAPRSIQPSWPSSSAAAARRTRSSC